MTMQKDEDRQGDYDLETLAVRAGIHRSQFGEHSEAMYLTSSFVFDNAAQAALAKRHGALLAVDNCFCSPALQKPLQLGADLVIHSATKYLDGQGRVMGGAVLGRNELVKDLVFPFQRTAGFTLSAFN